MPLVIGTKEGWRPATPSRPSWRQRPGAEGYKGLWTGETQWTDPKVTEALDTFKKIMTYANTDCSALTWGDAAQYLVDGKGAMHIMGDWTDGWFTSKRLHRLRLGAGAGHPGHLRRPVRQLRRGQGGQEPGQPGELAEDGGLEGGTGSLQSEEGLDLRPHRLRSQAVQRLPAVGHAGLGQDAIVPSVAHGAAAVEKWATVYKEILITFATKGDVAATQGCVATGVRV